MAVSSGLGVLKGMLGWLALVWLFYLPGCRALEIPAQPSLAPQTETQINGSLPTHPSTYTPESKPTAVLIFQQSDAIELLQDPIELPTPVPDPLRFVFPTALAAPVSAWRPPLYPTPWALTPYDHFYFARPIAADQINWPSQNYRYGGEFFQDVVHTGVDIPAPQGTPVLAAGPGKVIWAGYGAYRGGVDPTDPYGLAVVIRHDFGYQGQVLFTVYGHLDQVDVAEGQVVQTGDLLGLVGETGRVTGPHLHFEVRLGENSFFSTRNPELWIVPPIGWGVLAGQVLDSNGRLVDAQPFVITSTTTGQNWFSRSYGSSRPVNSDLYYQENFVVGDLPAGNYLIRVGYAGLSFSEEVEIFPGQVSYFYFYGKGGMVIAPPPTPQAFSIDATPTALDK